jgi:ferrous iron transport protein B
MSVTGLVRLLSEKPVNRYDHYGGLRPHLGALGTTGRRCGDSLLARMGRWLQPPDRLMGLNDWRLIAALLTSFIAKENTIATLGIPYGAGEPAVGLAERVAATLPPAAGLAFLVIQMLFIPCVATMAVIKQEAVSWRWMGFSLALLSVISLGAGAVVYQRAFLLGRGV